MYTSRYTTEGDCVYLDVYIYCSLNLKNNFRINIEITRGLRPKFVWPKLYYLGRAINTGYEIQTNDCFKNAYSYTFEIQLKFLTRI